MNENEILAEIRTTRDEHARKCGYDIHTIFDELRAETNRLRAEGWPIESPEYEGSAVVREEPPKGI